MFAIVFPSAEGAVKFWSLASAINVSEKKTDSIPSMKFATLKRPRAVSENEVCGGGPPGIPPPAWLAVAWESS